MTALPPVLVLGAPYTGEDVDAWLEWFVVFVEYANKCVPL